MTMAELDRPAVITAPRSTPRPTAVELTADPHARVRLWLWTVAALVFFMIIVGGATRLTGSGLSITEWRPITGALPPLSHEAWLAEFERYRQIPQYQLLNRGMSLDAFKVIYWWEWGHRQLGRFIGVVYVVPLLAFAIAGVVRGRLLLWLAVLGALGGFQGLIGWVMVASGLEDGMVAVAPVKLMLHLTMACVILTLLVMTARRLTPAVGLTRPDRRLSVQAGVLLALLFAQIALGALVAGTKAGLTFNTWPLMDGALVPSGLLLLEPVARNLVENVALVQWNHRMAAYLLVAWALWHAWCARRTALASGAAWVAGMMVAQAALGVVTLLLVVPLWAALAHQGFAAAILIAAAWHGERAMRPAPPQPALASP